MKLIIPMAGRGTRVRPHSHVTPKPLLNVRGQSMVERIVKTFAGILPRPLTEAIFILGPDFPREVYDNLTAICERNGIRPGFAVQETAEGTAHAVHSAAEHLAGEGVIVFADTLFYMDEKPDLDADAIVWVKHVEDPRRFGVAVREGERVTAFVEKPQEPISNEALIGIYYMRDLSVLGSKIKHIIDAGERGNTGEYQLTDALDLMLKDGAVFKTAGVTDWLDCGTIPALLETTKIILAKEEGEQHAGVVEDSILIEPVYIGPQAQVRGSVVGPNVSIEEGAIVEGSVVRESVVFARGRVQGSVLDDSLVGQDAVVTGASGPINVGDHSHVGPRG
jgi:glucose-1-phosphate thymidylyltransferase